MPDATIGASLQRYSTGMSTLRRRAKTDTPCSQLTFFFGVLFPRPCDRLSGVLAPGKHPSIAGNQKKVGRYHEIRGRQAEKGDHPRNLIRVHLDRDHLLFPGFQVTYCCGGGGIMTLPTPDCLKKQEWKPSKMRGGRTVGDC